MYFDGTQAVGILEEATKYVWKRAYYKLVIVVVRTQKTNAPPPLLSVGKEVIETLKFAETYSTTSGRSCRESKVGKY